MNDFIDANDATIYFNDLISNTINKSIYNFIINDIEKQYSNYLVQVDVIKKTYIKDIPITNNNDFNNFSLSTSSINFNSGIKVDSYRNILLQSYFKKYHNNNDEDVKKRIEYTLTHNPIYFKYNWTRHILNDISGLIKNYLYYFNNNIKPSLILYNDMNYENIYKTLFYEYIIHKVLDNKLIFFQDNLEYINNSLQEKLKVQETIIDSIQEKLKIQETINDSLQENVETIKYSIYVSIIFISFIYILI
jgi:hypothetical protein